MYQHDQPVWKEKKKMKKYSVWQRGVVLIWFDKEVGVLKTEKGNKDFNK